ncbi:MAG: HNH endonuclease [Candidatus Obscuribacterales bacterium]|nr:HNH endonuclease [Candidatus Obscuribacterales bacterium]
MKYSFSKPERFGIYRAFDHICYWCRSPVEWLSLTIDHVIPEELEKEKERLDDLKKYYGLPDSFLINDFENWVPAHLICNGTKSTEIYYKTPAMVAVFAEVRKRAVESRKIFKSYKSDYHFARLETIISTAHSNNQFDLETISKIKSQVDKIFELVKLSDEPTNIPLDNTFYISESVDGISVHLFSAEETVAVMDEVRIIEIDTKTGKVLRDSSNE